MDMDDAARGPAAAIDGEAGEESVPTSPLTPKGSTDEDEECRGRCCWW